MEENFTLLQDTERGAKFGIAYLKVQKESTRQELFKRVVLAKDFISDNYNRKFSLKEVALEACLSVNHLLRSFKAVFGLSPYQFLAKVKLSKARHLLEKGNYRIAQVAYLVGFDSISSFIRLFKSAFNITPLQYKRQHNAQKPWSDQL